MKAFKAIGNLVRVRAHSVGLYPLSGHSWSDLTLVSDTLMIASGTLMIVIECPDSLMSKVLTADGIGFVYDSVYSLVSCPNSVYVKSSYVEVE